MSFPLPQTVDTLADIAEAVESPAVDFRGVTFGDLRTAFIAAHASFIGVNADDLTGLRGDFVKRHRADLVNLAAVAVAGINRIDAEESN